LDAISNTSVANIGVSTKAGQLQTSTIWVLSNQVTANSLKISLQTALVNAVVHEWYHSWNPNDTDENDAIAAGNAAQIAYTAGGGDSQNCAKGGS
jgi:hypothetical protein